MSDAYDPDANSERSYRLAIAALREINIRKGQIKPETQEERQWASEGPVEPSRLEAARG